MKEFHRSQPEATASAAENSGATNDLVDSSPRMLAQRRLLQSMGAALPVQRQIDVRITAKSDDRVDLMAQGKKSKFKGNSGVVNTGWLNVDKYRAYCKINDERVAEVGPLGNDFEVPNRGHILASQNGGRSDPKNMFAQDGGTNNSHYKPFEEEMKREIDDANSQDEITFVAYLVGDGITPIIQGDIMSSAKPTRSPISSPARANNNDDNSADEDDLYDSSEEKEDYDDEDFLEKETSRKRKSRKI